MKTATIASSATLNVLPENMTGIFEPKLTAEILQVGRIRHYVAGEAVIDYGETIEYLPIIISGVAKTLRMDEDGREILLYYLHSQDGCALSFFNCMEDRISEIRAVAEDDAEVLLIPVRAMEQWFSTYPSWKKFVMKTMRLRFDELLRTIDKIAFQKLDERLEDYLKEKSKALNTSIVPLSHEQIANELATSRVVVSRLLKTLENEKKVILYRNQIKLLRAFFE